MVITILKFDVLILTRRTKHGMLDSGEILENVFFFFPERTERTMQLEHFSLDLLYHVLPVTFSSCCLCFLLFVHDHGKIIPPIPKFCHFIRLTVGHIKSNCFPWDRGKFRDYYLRYNYSSLT